MAEVKQELQWPADKVERWPIDRLVPHARNSRTHSPAQIDQLAASMREWGWTMPVLADEGGTILAGHARVMAAQKLELAEVPVMVAQGWSDSKKRAYIIADNKLSLNSGWDIELLKLELSDISSLGELDIKLTGFDDMELRSLFDGDPTDKPPPDEFGAFDEGIETEHECPSCGYRFSAAPKGKKAKGGSTIDNPPEDDFPEDE